VTKGCLSSVQFAVAEFRNTNKILKTPQLNIQGEGQPFVWLHGMLNSVESDSVYSLIDFESLPEQVSVVRYNYCDKSVDGDYGWPALTNELINVLNAQKYDKVVLGGLSMGAGTAIHSAVQFPERVKALILVTPPPAWEIREKVKAVYRKVIAKTNSEKIPEILKRIIQLNEDPPEYFVKNHPGTRQQLLEHRLSFEPKYYTQIYVGGANSDFPSREQISEINVPTMIISQPDDANHPVEIARELNKLIKGSEMVLISNYEDYQNLQITVRHFVMRHAFDNKS
jgi:3-oxoadipate enol-lactonase